MAGYSRLLVVWIGLTVSFALSAAPLSDIDAVRAALVKMVPDASEATIEDSPVDNVYQVQINGSFGYVFVDGDFVLLGDLFDTQKQVNLGDQASNSRMADVIKEVPSSEMIIFSPEGETKRHITVFTDIDCGYCRKLHNEVPELLAAGIEVRYLAYPRAGVGSNSFSKYVSVWCNDEQQASLTDAKAGTAVEEATCENPVLANYQLGQQVGVRGTPTIIFDDGTVTPGYQPSSTLIERLAVGG